MCVLGWCSFIPAWLVLLDPIIQGRDCRIKLLPVNVEGLTALNVGCRVNLLRSAKAKVTFTVRVVRNCHGLLHPWNCWRPGWSSLG